MLLSLVLTVIISILMTVYAGAMLTPRVDMVARVHASGDTAWSVSGRVLRGGSPVAEAKVWVVAHDNNGNSFAPTAVVSDSAGTFTFQPFPRLIGPTDSAYVRSVIVSARTPKRGWEEEQTLSRTLNITGEELVRFSPPPHKAPFVILVIFGFSLLLALTQFEGPKLRHTQYVALIGLSVLLICLTLVGIASALREIEIISSHAKANIISFGFAYAVKGTYVSGEAPQWVLSLSPVSSSSSSDPTALLTGVGAPLWVLLVSVAGAGLFTLSIVIRALKEPLDTSEEAPLRPRIQEVILHQFYVIFSPLGSIFVYQLLIVAGAATKPIVVALAALASGVTLNLLLKRAVQAVETALSQPQPPTEAPAPAPEAQG